MHKRHIFALALTIPALCLSACANGESEKAPEPTTVTKTVTSPARSTESTTQSTTKNPAPSTSTTRTTDTAKPTGYTDAPNGEPTAINKAISHCAKSSQGLYEQGTTWFTDGTSGWTQYCANNFYDGPSTNTAPEPQTNEPSPWVQGQIDWADFLNSGHSEEECRAMLN
ncbi:MULTISPECIES: hypothetical protein [unclassified Corynebacterium]|uniref:hypothetical protein n=1 Tax=unclassified Corynebacterium TaxID=2624378 RepID=UPI0008A17ABF|nr:MULTISPECIES: hypothetical protein [unclassified Corynebacterium]MBC6757907.1 hypothetical protein [Corynebacterium sp. LK24]OFN08841.1 hypothetical protein HMPREF2614_03845 [Corynebacterium sp. HMSC074C11]